ncbi:unnamed protein product [Brassica oleracea]
MVCCDFCQRWVHCMCGGIRPKNLEDVDVVHEIWKRKGIDEKELIASL